MPHEDTTTEGGRIQRYITRKRWKTNNKRVDRNGDPIRFDLKGDDIRYLLNKAGITIFDLGEGADGYCLARENDLGSYSRESSRFITNSENAREKGRGV